MLRAYVIGLKEPTHLLQTLPMSGILPTWIQGVNGSTLTDAEFKDATTVTGRLFATRTAIAIGMSHLKALQTFVNSREDYALIAEDDIVIEPTFQQYLPSVMSNVPSDYDMLYIGCFGCRNQYSFMTLIWSLLGYIPTNTQHTYINEWVDKPAMVMGAHAYIISRVGAQKLLSLLHGRLWQQIDVCYQAEMVAGNINVYVSKPLLATQTSTMPTPDNSLSSNVATRHPIVIQKLASQIYPDKSYNMMYFLSFILIDKPFVVTVMMVLAVAVGLVIMAADIRLLYASIGFFILVAPDILMTPSWRELLIYYAAIVGPTLLERGLHLLR